MADPSSGIRASGDEYLKPRLRLTGDNINVWLAIMETMFREKKVWAHIKGTAAVSGPPLTVAVGVVAVAGVGAPGAAGYVAPVTGVPAVAQAMVDARNAEIEKFEVDEAKATSMLLITLKPEDVVAINTIPTVAAKWAKIVADYQPVSSILAMNASNRFFNFSMGNETIQLMQNRFDGLASDCVLQKVPLTPVQKTNGPAPDAPLASMENLVGECRGSDATSDN